MNDIDMKKHLDDLLDAVEEKKKNLQASAIVAKNEFLETLDNLEEKVEDKIEDIDTDSLKMKLTLAKLKILEEWDEIEDKIDNLGGKAKEIAESSEDEIKEGWESVKELAGNIEDKISKFFSKNV